jgi:uncharacterized membrane protein YqjE
MNTDPNNGRSLASILSEMKVELQEFVQTRLELLKSELEEKVSSIKAAIPLAVIGALFLSTAFLVFSLALVALVAVGFDDNPYRWFFGALIVCVLWCVIGAVALYSVIRRFRKQTLVPTKTIEVLSGDKLWLRDEARKAL